jgi:hypothetical protein
MRSEHILQLAPERLTWQPTVAVEVGYTSHGYVASHTCFHALQRAAGSFYLLVFFAPAAAADFTALQLLA